MSKEEEKEKENDVLQSMLMTLDVSHFEISPLNAEAEANAIQKKQKVKKFSEKERK